MSDQTQIQRLSPDQKEALARFEADARDIESVRGKGLVPKNAAGLWWLAKVYEKSGMLPEGIGTRERAFMAMQFGMELGLTPTECLRSVMVVNNRPALYGDVPLGLIRASGKLEWIEETIEGEGDAMVAVCRCKRVDQAAAFEERFGVADAQASGLLRSAMYTKYRRRMLKYRARGYCLRDAFPEVLMGAYTVEEVEGSDTPPPVAERVTPERTMGADELTEALRAKAAEPAAEIIDAAVVDTEPDTEPEAKAAEPEPQKPTTRRTRANKADETDRPPTTEELCNQPPFDPEEV